jgi:hypothetical protein
MKPIPAFFLCLLASAPFLAGVDIHAETSAQKSSVMLAGPWVPPDSRDIDFDRLPRLPHSDHVIVHDVRDQHGHRVNQHNYLVFHDGLYWAMWSDGPGVSRKPPGEHRDFTPGHDQAHQKVAYATSKDGLHWSKAGDITDTPAAPYGYIARGFWVREGKLLALASRFEAPSYHGDGLALHAFAWDKNEGKWEHLGILQDDALNNFPPGRLASDKWMMIRRDGERRVSIMLGGDKAYNQWESIPLVSYSEDAELKPTEPIFWQLPDQRIMALFRDNSSAGFLLSSVSTDDGRTWSKLVQSNFPDASSKFNAVRLADGRYAMVSNPHPKRRDPLALALSDDGIVFNKMIYLVGGRKVDYPDIMTRDGYIFVSFASAKQSVELIRIKISDLDKVAMPTEPLVVKKNQ